ncbi:MAG: DedA family protein [Proteobacteria bacterium]|nr:DedA family protein [Pseudomonadota bacterium]MCL2308330.1 DedA family protein [Pseudomonadota bacterium]
MITTLLFSLLTLDQTLANFVAQYGVWVYALLFIIIFAETGFVIFPFLPGDSLLFIAGTVAAATVLDVHTIVILLITAAILGDSVNYAIGRKIGQRVYTWQDSRWYKRAYLMRTQMFYEKYGSMTIIIARFVPIVRTFAPFLAGVVAMSYPRFLTYNIVGGVLWITSLVYLGYFFGNIPFIKNNLSFFVFGIILISLIPIIVTYLKEKRAGRSQKSEVSGQKSEIRNQKSDS